MEIWAKNVNGGLPRLKFLGVTYEIPAGMPVGHVLVVMNVCITLFMTYYRMSKKLSFTKLNIWRYRCQLGRNTYDICGKSANAQFGKTQFFETPCITKWMWSLSLHLHPRQSYFFPHILPDVLHLWSLVVRTKKLLHLVSCYPGLLSEPSVCKSSILFWRIRLFKNRTMSRIRLYWWL